MKIHVDSIHRSIAEELRGMVASKQPQEVELSFKYLEPDTHGKIMETRFVSVYHTRTKDCKELDFLRLVVNSLLKVGKKCGLNPCDSM